jgi:hypothetical protein
VLGGEERPWSLPTLPPTERGSSAGGIQLNSFRLGSSFGPLGSQPHQNIASCTNPLAAKEASNPEAWRAGEGRHALPGGGGSSDASTITS